MRGAGDLVAADLPAEFHEPVAYYDRWLWLALLVLLAVVLYYVLALLFTRSPRSQPDGYAWWRPEQRVDPRAQHLGEIDRIEAQVRDGEIGHREAHQRLSETVRSYVDTITPLPASTMSLADLRAAAPGELAHAIELMYPPEFAPGEDEARERFDAALHHARRVVMTWT
jgi:hypothetical protein